MRQFQGTTTAIVEPQAKKFARVAHRLQAIVNPKTVMAVGILLCLFDAGVIGRTLIHSDVSVVGGDFHAYLQAAHLFRAGKNPYDPAYWPSTFWFGTASVHDQYAYPPIFAQVIMVLSIPGDIFGYVVWVLLSIAAFVGSLVLLLRHFGVRLSWPWTILIIGLALSSYPARSQVFSGQTNWVQLGLLTLGIWLYGRGRPTATGILWALVIVVKPFLILLLVYLIWKRSWRAVCSCI
ncbi:MAG TPA: glycosyltransferase family 87 protein, partial [Ktedonobacterales bacterium]|nr:glycosyltransferase family 87 protein [Ktedonobacterales bacterium]